MDNKYLFIKSDSKIEKLESFSYNENNKYALTTDDTFKFNDDDSDKITEEYLIKLKIENGKKIEQVDDEDGFIYRFEIKEDKEVTPDDVIEIYNKLLQNIVQNTPSEIIVFNDDKYIKLEDLLRSKGYYEDVSMKIEYTNNNIKNYTETFKRLGGIVDGYINGKNFLFKKSNNSIIMVSRKLGSQKNFQFGIVFYIEQNLEPNLVSFKRTEVGGINYNTPVPIELTKDLNEQLKSIKIKFDKENNESENTLIQQELKTLLK